MKQPLLLIGPTFTPDPASIGGTTTLFHQLVDHLTVRNISHKVVSINRCSGVAQTLRNVVFVLADCSMSTPKSRLIMVNVSARGVLFLAPLLWMYARLWRKPFVLRGFGGDFKQVYESQSSIMRKLLDMTVLRADLVLFETLSLVSYFAEKSPQVKHLPNTRELKNTRRPTAAFQRRFVFIGQIREPKGVSLLLQFIEKHGQSFTVDLYGPILDESYRYLENKPCYKGIISPHEVSDVLAKYDMLLLPTKHFGEGYPGVIIEANAAGLPVISTQWLSIPELVQEGKTGLLVPPDDYAALEASILAISDEHYQSMATAAHSWSRKFSSQDVHNELLDALLAL